MEKPQPPTIKKGASYPKEFREEAVRYWLSSGKKAKVVAAELGVSDWSLNRWRQEREGAPASIAPEAGQVAQVNALELAKENGRLHSDRGRQSSGSVAMHIAFPAALLAARV